MAMVARGYDGEVRAGSPDAFAAWRLGNPDCHAAPFPVLAVVCLSFLGLRFWKSMHHSIEIDNLTFSYPDGHPALRCVFTHYAV